MNLITHEVTTANKERPDKQYPVIALCHSSLPIVNHTVCQPGLPDYQGKSQGSSPATVQCNHIALAPPKREVFAHKLQIKPKIKPKPVGLKKNLESLTKIEMEKSRIVENKCNVDEYGRKKREMNNWKHGNRREAIYKDNFRKLTNTSYTSAEQKCGENKYVPRRVAKAPSQPFYNNENSVRRRDVVYGNNLKKSHFEQNHKWPRVPNSNFAPIQVQPFYCNKVNNIRFRNALAQ
jgi:hypothetical protein